MALEKKIVGRQGQVTSRLKQQVIMLMRYLYCPCISLGQLMPVFGVLAEWYRKVFSDAKYKCNFV